MIKTKFRVIFETENKKKNTVTLSIPTEINTTGFSTALLLELSHQEILKRNIKNYKIKYIYDSNYKNLMYCR